MAYRESGGEALFEGELVVAGWLSSPLVWIPQPALALPFAMFFVVGPAIALLPHRHPIITIVTMVALFVLSPVVYVLAFSAYLTRLRPRVRVHGDRVVLSTTRRTLTLPRSGLATTVEHRRYGRHGYSCIVLSSDAVKLAIGTPKLLAEPSNKWGIPHLECEEATLLELATALGVELVPPAPAAAGKRRWRD